MDIYFTDASVWLVSRITEQLRFSGKICLALVGFGWEQAGNLNPYSFWAHVLQKRLGSLKLISVYIKRLQTVSLNMLRSNSFQ